MGAVRKSPNGFHCLGDGPMAAKYDERIAYEAELRGAIASSSGSLTAPVPSASFPGRAFGGLLGGGCSWEPAIRLG